MSHTQIRFCELTGQQFTITPQESKFLQKIGVPEPTLCPTERERLRLCFRNDHNLYRRLCSLSGKSIVSMFNPQVPFPVYANTIWWGDSWSALDYGRNFDFSRTFFEQFAELQKVVPHFALYAIGGQENSDYTHHSVNNKNCYLCYSVIESQNCLYSENIDNSQDCLDCSFIHHCELCYHCLDCAQCYSCCYLQNCEGVSESAFCRDLKGCDHCIGCSNLVKKKYQLFNQPVSVEQFEQYLQQIRSGNLDLLKQWQSRCDQFLKSTPQRALTLIQSEDCLGDRLKSCIRAHQCFDCYELQDCGYCARTFKTKDSYDCYASYDKEQQYFVSSSDINFGAFATYSFANNFCWYVDTCHFSNNLFACVGMNKAEYCIFNKKYSPQDYEILRTQIIEHMKKTGEWGRFFPVSLSPFAYNESAALDYYPREKSAAIQAGLRWYEDPQAQDTLKADGIKILSSEMLPRSSTEVNDALCQQTILCQTSGRPYRIVPQELNFYRRSGLPIPQVHPDVRYRQRLAKRNPRMLRQAVCCACHASTLTSFKTSDSSQIYCQDCYRQAFFA